MGGNFSKSVSSSRSPKSYEFSIDHVIQDHKDSVTSVRCNGISICSSANDGNLRIHHLRNVKKKESFFCKHVGSSINHICLLTKRVLLVANSDGDVFGFNLEKGSVEKKMRLHKEPVLFIMRVSSDVFLTADYEGNLFFNSYFDAMTLSKLKENWTNYYFPRFHLLKTGNNNMFAYSTTKEFQIRLVMERKVVKNFHGHTSFIYALDSFMNPKKQEILVSGGNDQMIILWNLKTGIMINKLTTGSPVWSLLVYHDFLISGLGDGSVELYNYFKMKKIKSFKIHQKAVTTMAWMKVDERFKPIFLTGSSDKLVKVVKMIPNF